MGALKRSRQSLGRRVSFAPDKNLVELRHFEPVSARSDGSSRAWAAPARRQPPAVTHPHASVLPAQEPWNSPAAPDPSLERQQAAGGAAPYAGACVERAERPIQFVCRGARGAALTAPLPLAAPPPGDDVLADLFPAVAGVPVSASRGGAAAVDDRPLIDLASPQPAGGLDALPDDLGLGPLPSPAFGGALAHRRTSVGLRKLSMGTCSAIFGGLTPSPALSHGRPSLAPGQVAPSPAGGFDALIAGIMSPKVCVVTPGVALTTPPKH